MDLPGISVLENVEAFGVRSHDGIFNSVVNHLHEVAAAVRAAMQVAFFGCTLGFLTAGGAIDVAAAGSQTLKNGIEVLNDAGLAADHLTIAAFQSPDAAAVPTST